MQHIGKVLLLHYTMDREVYSQSNFISGRGTQANSTAPYQPTPMIKPAFVPFREILNNYLCCVLNEAEISYTCFFIYQP